MSRLPELGRRGEGWVALQLLLFAAIAGCGFVGNGGERQAAAVVRGICLDCHNTAEQTGGLDLERRKLDAVASDAETWEKAILKVRSGLMPPPIAG